MLLEAQSALCNLSNPASHQERRRKTTTGASFNTCAHTCTAPDFLLELKRFMTDVTLGVCAESPLEHQIILTPNTEGGSVCIGAGISCREPEAPAGSSSCVAAAPLHTRLPHKHDHPATGRRRKRFISPPCSPLCCQGNSGHLSGPVGSWVHIRGRS